MQEKGYIRNNIESEIGRLDKLITDLIYQIEVGDLNLRPSYYSRMKHKLETARQDQKTLIKRLEEYEQRYIEAY